MSNIEKKLTTGRAIPIEGNDIDTDRIIPARFMKCITFDGLGEFAFYDARFSEDGSEKDHPFNKEAYRGGKILLVNQNFGCGSSREHAPQALQKYGITGIVGESFAEIFNGNCTALGIPAVRLSKESIQKLIKLVKEDPSVEVTIDLPNEKVFYGEESFPISMQESYKTALIEGTWDSTNLLLKNNGLIEETAQRLPYIK